MPASPGLRARATRARGRGKAYFHTSDYTVDRMGAVWLR